MKDYFEEEDITAVLELLPEYYMSEHLTLLFHRVIKKKIISKPG